MYNGYKVVALCISKAGNERSFEFIKAMSEAVTKSGYRLFIYHTCSDLYWKTRSEEGDKAVFDLMDFDVIDAVVIFDEGFRDRKVADEIAERSLKHNVPVICVGIPEARENCINFLFGYADGFEKVVRHLIVDHGVRNICMISGKQDEFLSQERVEAYKKVLLENGLPFDENRVLYGNHWWKPIGEAIDTIIESGNIPEAIVCVCDFTAIAVCEELKKRGYAVPEDVKVVGFDGTREARLCIPPITTCKCNFELLPEQITAVLAKCFRNETVDKVYPIEFTLEKYCSCGCEQEAEAVNVGELLKKAEDRFGRYQDDELALYEMSERITECDSPARFVEYLSSFKFYNTSIVVNSDCLDASINPTGYVREESYDDVMQMLYRTESELSQFPLEFKRKEILPGLKDMIHYPNPLVFSALSFFGKPMGFVCFNFEADIDEYCKILQYVTTLNNSIGNYRMVKYLKHVAEYEEKMSKQDFMTDLLNRKGFYNALPELLERAGESQILVATIDIDGLKNINDEYGHEDGDFVIKAVSNAVKALPFEPKICGRFGGDELVVCALVESAEAEAVLKKSITDYIDAVNKESGRPYKVSASMGVYVTENVNYDFEYALKRSDDEMYIMKIGRPNRRKN